MRELPAGHVRVELPLDHVAGGAWGLGEDHNVFTESVPLFAPGDAVVVAPDGYGDGQGDATNRGINFCVARVVAWRDAAAELAVHYCNSGVRNRELDVAQRTWRRAWVHPATGAEAYTDLPAAKFGRQPVKILQNTLPRRMHCIAQL